MQSNVAVIVIGRNEGARLRACLLSLKGQSAAVVYVDSGSTDGSALLAEDLGADVVRLDSGRPFTAARGRNEGLARALSFSPNIEFVQFVDADCEVQPDWLQVAIAALQKDAKLAAVCGRRRERHPQRSIYNALIDIEWDTPVGPAASVGGDAMFRVAAFNSVGGFNPDIAAGEEPELCLCLRQAGWRIQRLDAEMTLHDADLLHFGQWWRRQMRFGFATVDASSRRRDRRATLYAKQRRSARIWTAGWLGVVLIATIFASVFGGGRMGEFVAALLLVAPMGQAIRIAFSVRQRGVAAKLAIAHGVLTMIGKWAQIAGQWRCVRDRASDKPVRVIEYKRADPTNSVSLRLTYLTGEYPRVSHTFIQREVAALRELGHEIQTFSVRRPANDQIIDAATAAECDGTFYLLGGGAFRNLRRLLWAHAMIKIGSPRRFFRAVKLWLKICPRNPAGAFKHLAYFLEACLLARAMRRRGLTHLHNHFSDSSCTVAMLASVLGGFTFSFTLHGPADFLSPKYWRLDEKIRRAELVVCISRFAMRQAMIWGPTGCQDKLRIVHCGVDPAQFGPGESSNDAARLLFVGRLAPAKGLPILLRAFAVVRKSKPDATLTIAGDGPLRAELGDADGVKFLGNQSPEQIQGLLKQTDVFVMTSLAEGVPVVLMEAMAAEVPVVAPRIAGIPELICDGQNGLLTPPGDSDATASAILRLLGDCELRRAMGVAGRTKVEKEFNLSKEAERLAGLFTCVAQKRELPAPTRELAAGESTARLSSYLIVSPCRNEAQYLRRTIERVLAQTVLPAKWIIVDDGSTDQTPAILAEYAAKCSFIQIISRPDRGFRRLGGGVIDSFYDGHNTIDPNQFDYVAKLDLDVELPPSYFQTLIRRMEDEPRLGTCSGKPYFLDTAGRRISEPCGDEQSVGMAKFYRTTCFQQIGGLVRELMWDGIDGHRCRMLGWMAASWDHPDINFQHLRPMGTSDKSLWTGRKRHGQGQYFMGTSLPYMLASCIYRLAKPPLVIGSLAIMWGYLQSMVLRRPRYGDTNFRQFLRRYQWQCLIKGKAIATAELDARQTREFSVKRGILPASEYPFSIAFRSADSHIE